MRTTLTLDDDIANKLQAKARTTGKSFKQALNDTLRLGLALQSKLSNETPTPFSVRSRSLGIKEGVNYDNIGELLERIEGEDYK